MERQAQRPRITEKTKAKIGFFTKVMAVIKMAIEGGGLANKNKIYAQHGITTGSSIYTPRQGKFKGYMRDKSYKAKRR